MQSYAGIHAPHHQTLRQTGSGAWIPSLMCVSCCPKLQSSMAPNFAQTAKFGDFFFADLKNKYFFADMKNGNCIKMVSVWLIWHYNESISRQKPFWKHVFKILVRTVMNWLVTNNSSMIHTIWVILYESRLVGRRTSLVYKYWRSQTIEFATISFW